jgi:transcriptional regulator with XRE-family HTH domain
MHVSVPELREVLNSPQAMTALQEERLAQNISQRELARRAGVCRHTILRIESGENLPSMPTYRKLVAALDVPAERLLS